MMDLAAVYRQQFRTTFASMLQYRASLMIWMIAHVLEPLIYLAVWSAVANAGGGMVGDFSANDVVAYYLILMLVNHVSYTWIMYEFEYRVREGMLSAALLKPVHPIHSDIADNVTSKLVTLPFMLAVAAGLGWFFQVHFPVALWTVLLGLPALGLAFLLRFLLEWTLALAAFWTTRVGAVNQIYFLLMLFLSGQIAPIELLPLPLRVAATVLPFRWMLSFPVELWMGRLTPVEALTGLGMQTVWIAVGGFIVRAVWRAGVRVYSAVGA
jgi:ABC-2 type transport system permease protein